MGWRFALVLAVFLALLALLHVYLYRRLVRDVGPPAGWRRAGAVAFAVLYLLLAGAAPLEILLRTPWSRALAGAGFVWLGYMTYLAMAVAALSALAVPFARWRPFRAPDAAPASPGRRLFLSRAVAGTSVLAASITAGHGAYRAFAAPDLREVPLRLPRLPRALDGFTIVQLSDIHVGSMVGRRFVEAMVERANALRPDLLAITGDLVDGSVPHLALDVEPLTALRSRFGTFFVTGNHEYYSGDVEWCEHLRTLGITVLRNQRTAIGGAGASFDLVGVDDWNGRPGQRYDLGAALAGWSPDRAAVLMAHQPHNFEGAAQRGISVQLSGHTHGGQMFPLNLLLRRRFPHVAGHAEHAGAHLWVSRGVGFWGPPMRVAAPPEIARIVLLAG